MTKDFEMGYLLDFYGEVLTPKQREMLNQYYNDDLSLSEIGENFGITRQGAGIQGHQPQLHRRNHVRLDLYYVPRQGV